MVVASVLSLKGGVGKTTVTLGLASAAVARGLATVVVDLDPQTNTTQTLLPGATGDGVVAALRDPRRKVIARELRPSAWSDLLRVLPGSEAAEALNDPDPAPDQLQQLSTVVRKLDPRPDLVLLDCPPSLGRLTRTSLWAADRAVLVTEPALYSVAGVQRALEAVHAERIRGSAVQPLGVVVNRVRPRTVEHQFRLTELREIFGPLVLHPVLPDRGAVQQAQGAGAAIHRWPTAGAREVADTFDLLLDRLLRAGRAPAARR